MTKEQAELLKLGIPIDDTTCLYIESALLWVLKHTTLNFDINNIEELQALPANVKLFVIKYNELMSVNSGVASASIEGLSQSFNTNDKSGLILELAESTLDDILKSAVTFVPAVNRWN